MERRAIGASLAAAVLGLCWILTALGTLVLLLLLLHSVTNPECASYDPAGQRVSRIGDASLAFVLVGLWVLAVVALRSRVGSHPMGRVALGLALPLALAFAFSTGAALKDAAVERAAADDADAASCW